MKILLAVDGSAHTKLDVLVMGSHGHSGLANLLLGSVAACVMAPCKTPVMTIR